MGEHFWPNLNKFFVQVGRDANGSNCSFKCMLCLPKNKQVRASITSASNLRAHIKTTHASKLEEFNMLMEKPGKRKKLEEIEGADPSKKLKQCLLRDSLSGELRASREKREEAISRFVVGTNSPFSIVEHRDFVNLMRVVGGGPPPNRKRLMENLQNSFDNMKNKLKGILKSVQYVSTTADCWTVFRRWNSHFDALELIRTKEEKLDILCESLDLPKFKKPQDMVFLEEYCKVMAPIAIALDILQGDKNIYMGYLLPTLSVVEMKLTNLKNLQYCTPLKEALLTGFKKRFSHLFEDNDLVLAAILMPQFKLNWMSSQDVGRTELQRVITEKLQAQVPTQNLEETFPQEKSKVEQFFSCFNSTGNDDHQQDHTSVALEVTRFLFECEELGQLSKVIRDIFLKYNTAVPSSAHCERLFSAAGLLYTDRRSRMTDFNFEVQLLLKFNKYFE